MTNPAELPLAGIKVVDFTQVMMGPVATQVLGDYGADVVKIERPPTGDLSRTSFPNDPAGLQGPVFCSLNRNKRSIVLDLRKQEAKDAVLRLIDEADVVVNNFRAGVMERMGFSYETLAARNPRLIYAVGTGFGLQQAELDLGLPALLRIRRLLDQRRDRGKIGEAEAAGGMLQ